MPMTLRIIMDEHVALRSVLNSLELLIHRGPENDALGFFRSMRAMLFYIDQYPERLHHPKESKLLFPKVRERDVAISDVLDRLDEDHAKSEHSVRMLEHQLASWEFLGGEERSVFIGAFRIYKKSYLAHMELEEKIVLPAALRCLAIGDWRHLDEEFAANQDPLTGRYAADGIYAELFNRIVREAPDPIGLG